MSEFDGLKMLIEETETLSNFKVVSVNGKFLRDSGSSIVQELGFSLAQGAEYMTRLTEMGVEAYDAASKIKFNFGVGANYFMEIAKLRATLDVAKIVEAYEPKCNCGDDCDCEDECKDGICNCCGAMAIHSENTIWNKTVYDPYVICFALKQKQ